MYNCVSLAESLVIIELWIITKIPGKCGRSTIIYSSFRYYEVQILIIKLLWCGHTSASSVQVLAAQGVPHSS
jgi:hypothetical protein